MEACFRHGIIKIITKTIINLYLTVLRNNVHTKNDNNSYKAIKKSSSHHSYNDKVETTFS